VPWTYEIYFRPWFARKSTKKVAEIPKLAERLYLYVPPVTFRITFKVKRSKVKVTRPLIAVTENYPYLRNGKEYELQTLYTDGVQ